MKQETAKSLMVEWGKAGFEKDGKNDNRFGPRYEFLRVSRYQTPKEIEEIINESGSRIISCFPDKEMYVFLMDHGEQ